VAASPRYEADLSRDALQASLSLCEPPASRLYQSRKLGVPRARAHLRRQSLQRTRRLLSIWRWPRGGGCALGVLRILRILRILRVEASEERACAVTGPRACPLPE
jgi:hypothetical protein